MVKTMENTSKDVVLANKNALSGMSDNNTGSNFALKEHSNNMIDATFDYLNKMLLEEEINEKDIEYTEGPDLWAMEKLFYNIVGQEYPHLLNKLSLSDQREVDPTCSYSSLQYPIGSSLTNALVSGINQAKGKEIHAPCSTDNMASNSQVKKNMFPFASNGISDGFKVNIDNEGNENQLSTLKEPRGKKKSNDDELDFMDRRNCKIPVPYVEEPARDMTFDEVLLYNDFYTKEVVSLGEIMQTNPHNEEKIQVRVPDLKDLLIQCSQSIAKNDRKTAEAFIKEIRKHSSPDGDSTQRLAYMLVDALEARLNVTGNESYNRFVAKQISTTEYLKVHHMYYMTLAPFGTSLYFANETILKAVNKSPKLHIIDFGIGFGFQWPSLIQSLSNQKGRPIKLRITGIEFPESGFRPDKLVEETGKRLKEYARMFNVPFEYQGIASQWETLHVSDFKTEADEVLVVNSMVRFHQLGDETTGLDCPRDQVLKLIWHLRPDIFIYVNFNWTLSPFFITRFKQAMLLYGTLFDLLDAFIPRDNKVRKIIERDFLPRYAMNIIACEGTTWTDRLETYKRWHQRTVRAGFEQMPLDPTIVKKCNDTLKKIYDNKGFFMEEESNWFLQGWRGKILYGLSTWKPNLEHACDCSWCKAHNNAQK